MLNKKIRLEFFFFFFKLRERWKEAKNYNSYYNKTFVSTKRHSSYHQKDYLLKGTKGFLTIWIVIDDKISLNPKFNSPYRHPNDCTLMQTVKLNPYLSFFVIGRIQTLHSMTASKTELTEKYKKKKNLQLGYATYYTLCNCQINSINLSTQKWQIINLISKLHIMQYTNSPCMFKVKTRSKCLLKVKF